MTLRLLNTSELNSLSSNLLAKYSWQLHVFSDSLAKFQTLKRVKRAKSPPVSDEKLRLKKLSEIYFWESSRAYSVAMQTKAIERWKRSEP